MPLRRNSALSLILGLRNVLFCVICCTGCSVASTHWSVVGCDDHYTIRTTMLATWLMNHLMCGIFFVGSHFCVITRDQHVIHRWTRIINVKSQFSKSLEPTAYHPQEDHKWIHSPSWGEIERKLRETQHWKTSGGIWKTVIVFFSVSPQRKNWSSNEASLSV